MREAFDRVAEERTYQKQRWSPDHDSTKTPEEWLVLLEVYLGKAAQEAPAYKGPAYNRESFRKRLEQLGALAIAALENV